MKSFLKELISESDKVISTPAIIALISIIMLSIPYILWLYAIIIDKTIEPFVRDMSSSPLMISITGGIVPLATKYLGDIKDIFKKGD